MSFTGKRNGGPRKTTFHRKPKSRSMANRVWNTVYAVYGRPPSWMKMTPPRRWIEDDQGEPLFTTTTRWEISFDDEGERKFVVDGPAKEVVQQIIDRGAADV